MPIYLDTETTGLSPQQGAAIVEIAIVDELGRPLLDTLVDPGRKIPWSSQKIHGISDEMVRGKPALNELIPRIMQIITGQKLVIYNAKFDTQFLPSGLKKLASVECAMVRYSKEIGVAKWQKLEAAARHVGHQWTGIAHRAMADALACRSVWQWLEERPRARTRDTTQSHQPREGFKLDCRFCGQKLRLPRPGVFNITCPSCHGAFRAKAAARAVT